MKTLVMRAYLVIGFLVSNICMGQKAFAADSSKIAKSFKTYTFKTNNQDKNAFGYALSAAKKENKVRNLALYKNYVLVPDNVQQNVKKIDINTGKIIKVSPQLPFAVINEVTVFNGYIYVINPVKEMYVLDMDMKLIKTLPINDGDHYIYRQTDDSLIIDTDLLIDIYQPQDPRKEAIVIDREHHGEQDTLSINKAIYSRQNSVRGMHYYINNDTKSIKTPYGLFAINTPYPIDMKTYAGGKNIDFDENRIVYLVSMKNTVFVYCYWY